MAAMKTPRPSGAIGNSIPLRSKAAMTCRLTVAIIDHHRMVAESFARILGERCDIAGVAHNRGEALQLASDKSPRIILLDISLGQDNGLALILELKRRAPTTVIIVVTNVATTEFQEAARYMGANGFISKTDSTEELLRTIESVANGESYYSALHDDLVYVPSRLDPKVHLSPR
jgi:DNA-binding NarL/FixJ family response regulator